VLWEAWESGTPDVGHETLLNAAEAKRLYGKPLRP
jgi:hypothetical protein